MLQGRLVKVVGQLVPLGKNRANWMADGGSEAVARGEGVGVGEMFRGYFAVPLTCMVWVCWVIWAITRGTATAKTNVIAKIKNLFFNQFTSTLSFPTLFNFHIDNL